MIRAGAKPKVTMSAKLSKSFPIEEETFNKRAKKPSKKSNTIERPIKYEPKIKSPSKILIIDKQPQSKLQQVIAFGMCVFIFMNN